MATNTWVDLEIAEAEALADLYGAQYDLRSANDFAQLLEEYLSSDKPDWRLADPLTTATLVRYSRPFVTGVRKRLGDEALKALTPEQRIAHERLRAFRDKHIAHSVNAYEDNIPVARYWVERVHAEGIQSVSCTSHRIIGLSSADVESVLDLTNTLLNYLQGAIEREQSRLLQIVRAMPLETVLTGRQRTFEADGSPISQRRRT